MGPRDPETREGLPSKQFTFDGLFDFSYRPASYWHDLPDEEAFLSRIRGTLRRNIARRAMKGEELPRLGGDELYREAMEFVLEEKLTEERPVRRTSSRCLRLAANHASSTRRKRQGDDQYALQQQAAGLP